MNQITMWKAQLLDGAAGVFGSGAARVEAAAVDLKALHAKIWKLALENDFLEGALIKAGMLSAKRGIVTSPGGLRSLWRLGSQGDEQNQLRRVSFPT